MSARRARPCRRSRIRAGGIRRPASPRRGRGVPRRSAASSTSVRAHSRRWLGGRHMPRRLRARVRGRRSIAHEARRVDGVGDEPSTQPVARVGDEAGPEHAGHEFGTRSKCARSKRFGVVDGLVIGRRLARRIQVDQQRGQVTAQGAVVPSPGGPHQRRQVTRASAGLRTPGLRVSWGVNSGTSDISSCDVWIFINITV